MKIQLIHCVITTAKLDESVDFFTRLFDFEVVADVGFYKHLRAKEGVEIGFLAPNHPSQPPLYQPGWHGQGLIITIQVEDVKSIYENMKTLGVPIAYDLKKEDWGQLHFGIQDPNGIPVDIVQYE